MREESGIFRQKDFEMSKLDTNWRSDRQTQHYVVVLAVLCVLASTLYMTMLAPGHDWGDDFGAYLQLAKNIQEGLPYDHLTPDMGKMTPPGFPILLSAWSYISGWELLKLKAINVFSIGVLGILTFRLSKYSLSNATSFAASIAVLACPYFVFGIQSIITDIPYVAINTLCLVFATASCRDVRMWQRIVFASLASITLFIGLLFRPAAVALGASLLAFYVLRLIFHYIKTKTISRPDFFAFSIVVAALALFIVVFPGPFASHGANASAGMHEYPFIRRLTEEFLNFNHVFFGFIPERWPATFLLLAAVIGSAVRLYRLRELDILPIFVFIYGAMIIATPWNGGPRYQFPMIPIIIILASQFADELFRRVKLHRFSPYAGLIILCPLIWHGVQMTYGSKAYGYGSDEVQTPSATALFNWIKSNSDSAQKLCTFKPRALLYLTQRRSSNFGTPYSGSAAEYMTSNHCDFIILIKGEMAGPYAAVTAQARHDESLKPVFENADYAVMTRRFPLGN